MRINTLEASPAGTCRGHSSQTTDLGIITLGIIIITQDPETSTQGTTMEVAIIIDQGKDLLTDLVVPETGPLADTENIVLTLGTIEAMVLEKLPGRRATTAILIIGTTTLAMEVTTEGTARRP